MSQAKLFVGNLSWDASEDTLKDFFENHCGAGSVRSVRIVQDKFTGRSKGFGFVEMADQAAAQAAIDGLNETDFLGRPVRISLALEQERRPAGAGNFRGDRGDRGGHDRGPRRPSRRFEDQ